MRNAKCKMQNAKCGMRNAECGMQNSECRDSHSLLSLFPLTLPWRKLNT